MIGGPSFKMGDSWRTRGINRDPGFLITVLALDRNESGCPSRQKKNSTSTSDYSVSEKKKLNSLDPQNVIRVVKKRRETLKSTILNSVRLPVNFNEHRMPFVIF